MGYKESAARKVLLEALESKTRENKRAGRTKGGESCAAGPIRSTSGPKRPGRPASGSSRAQQSQQHDRHSRPACFFAGLAVSFDQLAA
jgi:hypothetical protein